MKYLVLWAALAAPLAAQAQSGYTIHGKVGTLSKPAMAFLSYQVNGKRFLDSTYLRNGAFTFAGKVSGPKDAHIRLKHDGKPFDPTVRETLDVLGFYIENIDLKLVSRDSIANAKIVGSVLNDENTRLTAYLRPFYMRFSTLNEEFKSKSESQKRDTAYRHTLDARAAQYQRDAVQAKLTYAKAHTTSFMALVALNSTLSDDADAVAADKIFAQFTPAIKDSDLGKTTRKRLLDLKRTQQGELAPDFTLADVNGKPVKLSDFRGQYVLLDFWASWCAPCRRENPNLVKSYNAYKSKGFTVLGVSLDKSTDKAKWQKAIETDGLAWTQVSDLKFWESDVAKLYDVKAIPMNFLIDREGKIVAKYLRGEALDKKLAEVLGK